MAFEMVAGTAHPAGTLPSPRCPELIRGVGVCGEKRCTCLETEVKKGKKKDGGPPVQLSKGIRVLR